MTDPLKDEATDANAVWKSDPGSTKVNISLKAGPYESPWITLTADNCEEALKHFGAPLAELMRKVADAQASFVREHNRAKDAKVPASGTVGKPAAASDPVAVDVPFAASPAVNTPKCAHGDRKYLEKNGKKGWICPQPNGAPGRCAPQFIE